MNRLVLPPHGTFGFDGERIAALILATSFFERIEIRPEWVQI
jgi:hypothetical protein